MMRLAETRNEVRVRPQKRSGADWTHCLKLLRVAETRNEVRVRPQKRSGADWTHCLKLLRVAETRNEVRVRRRSQQSGRLNATSYHTEKRLAVISSDSYNDMEDSNCVQEVEMDEQKEKSGCLDHKIMYPHGSEFCKDVFWDVYCFECVDGRWETHPWTGA